MIRRRSWLWRMRVPVTWLALVAFIVAPLRLSAQITQDNASGLPTAEPIPPPPTEPGTNGTPMAESAPEADADAAAAPEAPAAAPGGAPAAPAAAPGIIPAPPGAPAAGAPAAPGTTIPTIRAPAVTPLAPGLTVPGRTNLGVAAGASNTIAGSAQRLVQVKFQDTPIDLVLEQVAQWRGKILLKAPGIPAANINLRSSELLSVADALVACEALLAMNNIALVPLGDRFLKVVQIANSRQEAMQFAIGPRMQGYAETDTLISQVVTLKYMEIAEAQPVIQAFLHGYGKIQPLERTNGLLITDAESNIKRVLEILEYIDQPVESRMETRIYELRYAEAAQVATRLNEFVSESQGQQQQEKPRIATPVAPQPGQAGVAAPPGVIRAPRAEGSTDLPGLAATAAADAERGLIRGKVKIISDERSNIIFVISRPENFAFFDKIVAILDRPIDPDVIVRVFPLEYADSEEIAGILNEFIGAASAEKKTTTAPGAGAGEQPTQPGQTGSRSQEIRDFLQRQVEQRAGATRNRLPTVEAGSEKGNIGQLSPNTRILADKRTNALLLMGRKKDLDALEDIIKGLDVMLAQVLIETVILEVNLGNTLDTGVDWLQRSVTAYNEQQRGPGNGITVRQPAFSFGGGSVMIGDPSFQNAADVGVSSRNNVPLTSGGLTYYLTLNDLNLDVVIRVAASSRDARILSTPVILTTDNTEATIQVGESRPIVTAANTYDTGTQNLNYEYKDIGINLSVTPRINPQRYVVMEIKQTADNVGGFETINGNRVPIITKRELQAEIAVQSRNTICLGGLVGYDKQKSRNKIPILGDIPVLGQFFRADSRTDTRTELLVLITPYVLTTPDEALAETRRLHDNTQSSQGAWPRGWSDSPLSKRPEDLMREEDADAAAARKTRKSVLFPSREVEVAPPAETVPPPIRLPLERVPATNRPAETHSQLLPATPAGTAHTTLPPAAVAPAAKPAIPATPTPAKPVVPAAPSPVAPKVLPPNQGTPAAPVTTPPPAVSPPNQPGPAAPAATAPPPVAPVAIPVNRMPPPLETTTPPAVLPAATNAPPVAPAPGPNSPLPR